jgi:hypothetical protein
LSSLAAAKCPLQRRLHLHVAQLGDGEVEVLNGGVVLLGVVVEEHLSEIEMAQGKLGAEAQALTGLDRLFKVGACLSGLTEKQRCIAQQPPD